MIPRILGLTNYNESVFLFGPRQTGKTYLIKSSLKPDLYIDLLKNDQYLRYSKDLSLLPKEVAALKPEKLLVVIDEIQRVPEMLNDVHSLMESERNIRFILTGSSARKLRRGGVNLLGGRAITRHLHPLTSQELKEDFSLEACLRFGTLPKVVLTKDLPAKIRLLKSYVENYLIEEIQQEALTRNVPAFSRFLELAAFENGNILNFSNISREAGVDSKTIREYFHILEDTLLGFFLYPLTRSHRKKLVSHPKFYLFDPGVANALKHQLSAELVPASRPYGDAFEHWIILETRRLVDYREREVQLGFFRTTDGAEVDLILQQGERIWAVEIKSGSRPRLADVGGLRSFIGDHPVARAICVCQSPRPYKDHNIEFLPWQEFLGELRLL
ncbi:MAG: ATP-binding protein [Deltaproteobacteria bacterium]|nr:ATP-binding protein [Deltaproteobacteria bacterium]